jgi:PAS domain-containing protein
MKAENMTNEQLILELAAMRQRVVEIEINHKRAEEGLRESEERYRSILEILPGISLFLMILCVENLDIRKRK